MKTLLDIINRIELKVRQVVQKLETLENQNKRLITENDKLKQELNQMIADNKSTQIGLFSESTEDVEGNITTSVKNELDQYIEQIDVCIEKLRS